MSFGMSMVLRENRGPVSFDLPHETLIPMISVAGFYPFLPCRRMVGPGPPSLSPTRGPGSI